jgi:hypothetical protein
MGGTTAAPVYRPALPYVKQERLVVDVEFQCRIEAAVNHLVDRETRRSARPVGCRSAELTFQGSTNGPGGAP